VLEELNAALLDPLPLVELEEFDQLPDSRPVAESRALESPATEASTPSPLAGTTDSIQAKTHAT
jgi:hypothetical protein